MNDGEPAAAGKDSAFHFALLCVCVWIVQSQSALQEFGYTLTFYCTLHKDEMLTTVTSQVFPAILQLAGNQDLIYNFA